MCKAIADDAGMAATVEPESLVNVEADVVFKEIKSDGYLAIENIYAFSVCNFFLLAGLLTFKILFVFLTRYLYESFGGRCVLRCMHAVIRCRLHAKSESPLASKQVAP